MSSASIAIAAARTPYDSDRRNRSAVGATAGRIHRAGTSRNAGHRRQAQATIRSSSRLSIAALSPLDIARGYVRAASTANHAKPRPRPRVSSAVSEPAAPLAPCPDTRHSYPVHLRVGRDAALPREDRMHAPERRRQHRKHGGTRPPSAMSSRFRACYATRHGNSAARRQAGQDRCASGEHCRCAASDEPQRLC